MRKKRIVAFILAMTVLVGSPLFDTVPRTKNRIAFAEAQDDILTPVSEELPVPELTPEATATPTPELTATPTPEPTATPTPEPTATPTPEPTATPTPEPTATPTLEPTATPTPEPTATPTPEPTATPTPEPTATPTPEPTATPTPEPTATPTPEPTATPTSEPTATPTPEPTATPTPEPTATPTPEPTATPTPEPTATPTPEPTATPTPEPTATPTPEPTATPTSESTATPTPEPTATPTPEPTATPTPEPTATPTPEPTATPTPEPTATPTSESTATPTPEPTAIPTPEPTATPTPEPTVSVLPTPTLVPITMVLVKESGYGIVGASPLEVQLKLSGGMPELTIAWQVYKDGEVVEEKVTTETEYRFLPESAGEYVISATVKDAAGQESSDRITLRAISTDEILRADITLSNEYAVVNRKPVMAAAAIAGGVDDINIRYQLLMEDTLICDVLVDGNTFEYMPEVPGNYTLKMSVEDGLGQRETASESIVVYSEPAVLTVTSTASQYGCTGVKPLELQIFVEGGLAPFNIVYRVESLTETGSTLLMETESTELNCSYLPETSGSYRITATVTDYADQMQEVSVTVPVISQEQILGAQINVNSPYGVAAMVPITAEAVITGGIGEIQTEFKVLLNDAVVYSSSELETFSYLPEQPGDYTVVLTVRDAVRQEIISEAQVCVHPTPDPLILNLIGPRYGYAGEIAIQVQTEITGGMPEYSFCYRVYAKGEMLGEYEITDAIWNYMPITGGDHMIEVEVTDAAGQIAKASVTVPVAEKDEVSLKEWLKRASKVKLTSDWREDIVAIAETQLGYRESSTDYHYTQDDTIQYYNIYGACYGTPYEEWCAMFVAFCARTAGIPLKYFPVSSGCTNWKNAVIALNAFEAVRNDENTKVYEGYIPQRGDLIYFKRDGLPDDAAGHIGIVTRVDGDIVKTIEGNTVDGVARREYALTDTYIIGYANTATLMKRAGVYPQKELSVEIKIGSKTAQPIMLLNEDTGDDNLTFGLALAEGGLAFQYSDVVRSVWDANTHTFIETETETVWSLADNGGDIMVVTNTSAVPVKVTVYAQLEQAGGNSLTVRIDGGDSAEATLLVNESEDFVISLSGKMENPNASESVTIGKVYVELEEVVQAE